MPEFVQLTDGEYLNLSQVKRIQLRNDGGCRIEFMDSSYKRYDTENTVILKKAMRLFSRLVVE